MAAEKGSNKIAVEIKSFTNPSFITSFYEAIGKFISYADALEKREPDRVLFLAIPVVTYETYFEESVIASVVNKSQTRLLIYNPDDKTVVKWINTGK